MFVNDFQINNSKILNYLLENSGNYCDPKYLCDFLNISEDSLLNSIQFFKKIGYNILFNEHGYKLNVELDNISANEINKFFSSDKNILVFDEIDSTNTYLKNLDIKSDVEIVAAIGQTNGRGRRGKDFLSAYNKGIYFSFKSHLNIRIEKLQFYTICTVVAICRSLKHLYDIEVDIKWLNDIYFNNKKLCGILIESKIKGEEIEIVTGIGLNTSCVDDSICEIATSLEEILLIKINRNLLIATILNEYELIIEQYLTLNQKNEILSEYRQKLFIINQDVTIEENGTIFNARVLEVDENGYLMVEKNGEILLLNNGNISLKINV